MSKNREWLDVPEPVAIAYDFIDKVQEAKIRGLVIDGETALASIAASTLLRSYFERIRIAVEDGHFDPDHILETSIAFNFDEYDGEEESLKEESGD